jgi:2-dehydropantoate 2-reductase
MSTPKRSIAVIGMGPAGAILAAHLISAGHHVRAVEVWPEYRDAMRKDGLVLEGALPLQVPPFEVFSDLADLKETPPELIIIAVKIPEALLMLAEIAAIGGTAPVLLVQNGLEVEEPFLMTLGAGRVLRMVVNYAGWIEVPGRISVSFFNRPNWLGSFAPDAHPTAAEWAEVISQSGLETRAVHDIEHKIWEKAVLNAVLAPVSAVLGVTMGEALRKRDVAVLSKRLMEECISVAAACGYHFAPEFAQFSRHYLSQGDGHRPSMLVDIDRGRSTEIDWLNGKIVELARRHEIPVPVNEVITALVKSLEPHDAAEPERR